MKAHTMDSEYSLFGNDLSSIFVSGGGDTLRREDEWAICRLVTRLVTARSRKRLYGFADGFDCYEMSRAESGTIEIKGLMHWTEGAHGWIDPFAVKLVQEGSSSGSIGFEVYFGADEEPTVKRGDVRYRQMRDYICSVAFEELYGYKEWAMEFRGVEPRDDA